MGFEVLAEIGQRAVAAARLASDADLPAVLDEPFMGMLQILLGLDLVQLVGGLAEDVAAIDRRILNAATAVFPDQGYGRATMKQVAEVAKAGKTTLYSRYPTKADLFASVVTQSGAIFELANHAPTITGSKRDRLITAGNELAEFTLTPQSIALMRATFAERDAFPEIAREGFRLGFEDCARHIARALAGTTDAPAVEAELPAAQRFVELALHPPYMHAFFGADLADLRQRAPACVAEVVEFLLPVHS